MRIILQRVASASVSVAGDKIAAIGPGLMCLCGISRSDTAEDAAWCASKLLSLRLWPNSEGKQWAESAKSQGLEVLLVSQFTLHAILKGNKPDFHAAMSPATAETFFDEFVASVRAKHASPDKVQMGKFGANMQVELINDGPVTIRIDSDEAGFKKQKNKTNSPALMAGVGPGGMSKKQAKRLARKKAKEEARAASEATAATASAVAAPSTAPVAVLHASDSSDTTSKGTAASDNS